ncbi:hypothetical protein N7462_001559 [Penicillium macrosclerotiorum]|uniref:uncharacterized protein n=1 Tax=Penicillium macrosclerotiorum TaxID=303699 RepID=UPI0025489F13|nr:uncharacterized protein N7462_001559 [Penicillium macrosclerotiorum]KAJ5692136.1 hypothetical protein N7462_001559 [Penicillium macrosclerotiorum]
MIMGGTDKSPDQGTIQPFGIVFTDKKLPDILATCVTCFDYAIQAEPDSRVRLSLNVLRLRLTRWGEASEIYKKPASWEHDAHPDDLDEVRQSLLNMISLFETKAEEQEKDEDEDEDEGEDPALAPTDLVVNDTSGPAKLLQETLCKIAAERSQQGTKLIDPKYMECSWWSNARLKRAASFIDILESMFGSRRLKELCANDLLRIEDEVALALLKLIATDLDPWMVRAWAPNNHFRSLAFNLSYQLGRNASYASGLGFSDHWHSSC